MYLNSFISNISFINVCWGIICGYVGGIIGVYLSLLGLKRFICEYRNYFLFFVC